MLLSSLAWSFEKCDPHPLPSTEVVCRPENKIETPFLKRVFVTEIQSKRKRKKNNFYNILEFRGIKVSIGSRQS
jgi:hypothetical protein